MIMRESKFKKMYKINDPIRSKVVKLYRSLGLWFFNFLLALCFLGFGFSFDFLLSFLLFAFVLVGGFLFLLLLFFLIRDEVDSNVGDQHFRNFQTVFGLIVFENAAESSLSGAEGSVEHVHVSLFFFLI